MTVRPVARIRTDFAGKFGVPRQSGLATELEARIILEPDYRNPEALRGIEGYSHLWLIWQFSEAVRDTWSPTVRPPRLGGNTRMGVFATRSPFRPNALGLSSVVLRRVEWDTPEGPVLVVTGADLMDGTPLYDIKPYLPYTDSHPQATAGFAGEHTWREIPVDFSESLLCRLPENKREAAKQVLAQDPRPAYQTAQERDYGMTFAGYNIRFCVRDGVLTVTDVKKEEASR